MDRGTIQDAETFIGRFLKDTKIRSVLCFFVFLCVSLCFFVGSLDGGGLTCFCT